MVYSYEGRKDKPDTRFMQFDPAHSQMKFFWEGDANDKYRVSGLQEFSARGFGTFVAEINANDPENSKAEIRITFALEPGAFAYRIETTVDLKQYETQSLYSLKRVDSQGTIP